jgi:hypothetical protein
VELTLAEFAELSLRKGASAFDVAVARGIPAERMEAARLRRNERYSERLVGVEVGVREALRRARRCRWRWSRPRLH